MIERDPPRGTAQPKAWQAVVSAIPTEELIGRFSGANACAATPPKSARARGPRQVRASAVAGSAAGRPKRARRRRVAGRVQDGAEEVVGHQAGKATGGAREQAAPGRSVLAEALGRPLDRADEDGRVATVERVGEVDVAVEPLEPVAAEVERVHERGGDGHRVHRRAVVVQDARDGQLARPRAPADRRLRLEHADLDALARQRHRTGEPVGARADDDGRAHAGAETVGRSRVTSTGKSQDSSSHGPRSTMSAHVDRALLDHAVGGVEDPVALARVERGLRLERDHAQLARREAAALLHRGEQPVVVQVAVAEVPAVDDPRDQLALAHVVVADVVDRARDQAVQRPPVGVHRAEREALVEEQLGRVAVVDPRHLLDDDRGRLRRSARRACPRRRRRGGTATRSSPSCRRSSAWPGGRRRGRGAGFRAPAGRRSRAPGTRSAADRRAWRAARRRTRRRGRAGRRS